MKVLHLMQVWFISTLICFSTGARILAIVPLAFRSHQLFFRTVLKEIALKGHEVVVYSPFPQPEPVPNYTYVHVNTSLSDSFLDLDGLQQMFDASKIAAMKNWWLLTDAYTMDALKHENIQKLAKSEQKFDLVITEAFIGQEAFLAFGHKFNAPTIAIQSVLSFGVIDKVMGNSLALPYIPDINLEMSNKMSFLERLTNVYSTASVLYSYYNEHIYIQQSMMNKYLNFPNTPQLVDMAHNVSLVLFNYQATNSYPRPFPPNFVPLGGIHVSTDRKPLPKDMQTFMDEAKHGVIYFSLGTVVPDSQLPKDFYLKFIKAFEKLKQKVLWKTKLDKIPGIPDNVMLIKWAPQQDVLAHPNCVLFITHGGLLSQQEVTHAGVPVVAIPFLGDQPFNVRYYVEAGVGVKLDFLTLTEESIFTAINTVLSNPRYKENAVRLSKIIRDMPMTQAESAVYWVEYVLRHNGAHHLRPAAAHMPWYQLALLDVLAFVVLATTTIIVLICWVCWRISQWLGTSKKQRYQRKKKD